MCQISKDFKIVTIPYRLAIISKNSYDKFVEDATLLRAYLQRNESKLILACNIFVITGYQWLEFSFTVIRNFLGFVLDLQYLFHDCNHYQDEKKEQVVDVIFLIKDDFLCNTSAIRHACSVKCRYKHLKINYTL